MLRVNGLYGHIQKNNFKSLALLAGFCVLFELLAFMLQAPGAARDAYAAAGDVAPSLAVVFASVLNVFRNGLWWVVLTGSLCWLLMAWLFYSRMLALATGAEAIERRKETRLYNLVENLSIAAGLPMPAVSIMERPALNVYAAGLTRSGATIAVTRGLLDNLTDDELESILAHQMTLIGNGDIRLMAVTTLCAGIIMRMAKVILAFNLTPGVGMVLTLVATTQFPFEVMAIVAWGCAAAALSGVMLRFAVSRARQFVADAGAVELTRAPEALVSALRKIRGREKIEGLDTTIAAMMISSDSGGFFSTHPPIKERIDALRRNLPGVIPNVQHRQASADVVRSGHAFRVRYGGLVETAPVQTREGRKAPGFNLGAAIGAFRALKLPQWVTHPMVLAPAVVMNFGVTYVIASFVAPDVAHDIAHMFDPPPAMESNAGGAPRSPEQR